MKLNGGDQLRMTSEFIQQCCPCTRVCIEIHRQRRPGDGRKKLN